MQNNSSAVTFRSAEDIAEVCENMRNGNVKLSHCGVMAWSQVKRKKDSPDTEDEENEPRVKKQGHFS